MPATFYLVERDALIHEQSSFVAPTSRHAEAFNCCQILFSAFNAFFDAFLCSLRSSMQSVLFGGLPFSDTLVVVRAKRSIVIPEAFTIQQNYLEFEWGISTVGNEEIADLPYMAFSPPAPPRLRLKSQVM